MIRIAKALRDHGRAPKGVGDLQFLGHAHAAVQLHGLLADLARLRQEHRVIAHIQQGRRPWGPGQTCCVYIFELAQERTGLDQVLRAKAIKHVMLAGMVTSLCIDSTGRAAYERGYHVTVLSGCTSARTQTEQDFLCNNVFTLYGSVQTTSNMTLR